MGKTLKTLEEHERRFWDNYQPYNPVGKCGIACPKCGEELWADYGVCLASDPPQTPIFCKECDWRGSMH